MTIALVSHTVAQGTANGVTSGAIDTTGATLLVIGICLYTGHGTVTISDSKGNTWTARTEYGGGNSPDVRMFYAENPTVGSGHTFTVAGTNCFSTLCVAAFSGTATATVYDTENGTAAVGNGTSRQPGSVTPAVDNSLVVTALADSGTDVQLAPTGYTLLDQGELTGGATYACAMAYQIQTSKTATNPTWSWTNASDNTAASAVFAPGAGGGGGGTFQSAWAVQNNSVVGAGVH